jgi:hypothetical protein
MRQDGAAGIAPGRGNESHARARGARGLLTIGLFICFAIAGALVKLPASTAADADTAAAALLVVCILNAVVWAYLISRSLWAGWPLAAIIFGKLKRPVTDASAVDQPVMPATDWAWRLGLIIVAYVILYFTFGYFIAWRVPDVRTYYHGVDAGGFIPHMTMVVRKTPWLIPFQMVRALMWTALAMPVVRMMKGGRLEASMAVALLFSVVMNAQLLLPNAYMPEAVRMAHLVETASSNFLFGALVGWLLRVR